MKVIIAGGRNFNPNGEHINWLVNILSDIKPEAIISGTASGADKFGEKVGENLCIEVLKFYPKWNKYGNAAGPIRNEEMAKIADVCILFPGGKGTASMKKIAKKYNLKIIEYIS